MRTGVIAAAAATLLIARTASAQPVTEDTFHLRTTGDLVALCSDDRTDPNYTAAQNFCHGFAVGTYRTLVAVEMASRSKKKWFCPESLPATRNDAVASFIAWARSDTANLALTPTDGMFKYLEEAGRCK